MKPEKIICIVISILILPIFSACADASVEKLLSPPKLSEQERLITKALRAYNGGDFTLKYPKNGDFKNAFTLFNFDNDTDDEAVVFYEVKNLVNPQSPNISRLRAAFLDMNDEGEWVATYDLAIPGTDVERISFAKFGTENKYSPIICYGSKTSLRRAMFINYDKQNSKILLDEEYAFFTQGSFFANGGLKNTKNGETKGDGNSFFFVKNEVTGFFGQFFTFEKDVFGELYASETEKVSVSGRNCEYISVTKGFVTDDIPAFFLNYTVSENSVDDSTGTKYFASDILYFNHSGVLRSRPLEQSEHSEKTAVLFDLQSLSNSSASAFNYSEPYDIDGDGNTDIIGNFLLPGYENPDSGSGKVNTMLYGVNIVNFDINGGAFKLKRRVFMDLDLYFSFTFPDKWRNNITVRKNSSDDNKAVDFCLVDNLDGVNYLLKITIVPKDRKPSGFSVNYKFLTSCEKNHCDYYYSLSSLSSVSALEDADVFKNFRLYG